MSRTTAGLLLAGLLLAALQAASPAARAQAPERPAFALAIHGGAGKITRDRLTDDQEQAYRQKLEEALRAGHVVLRTGGSSVDAVVAAIQIMEESPLFNAGRGAVYTNAETNELDASVMEGRRRMAGAAAGVQRVKSPIALARHVMEASPHVLLAGEGAEAFAREQGLEIVPSDYFGTERRLQQLRSLKAREQGETGANGTGAGGGHAGPIDEKHGTVGAVALDRHGDLAAGTSTGGTTNKRWGRVGDSPVIGAGTYADNETCAVSATGQGEYFIRGVVAHDVAAMMRYAGLSVAEAASAVIHGKLTEMGGTGGVIAMDRQGNVAMPFNTSGMYRGRIDAAGNVEIEIYRD